MCAIFTTLILIFFLFLTRFYLNIIDLSVSRGVYLLSLSFIIVSALLIPIFTRFFEGFKLLLKSLGFRTPGFWFFDPGVFYWQALNIEFGARKTTTIGKMLISLTGIGMRLDSSICSSFNSFFDYFIKVIEFFAMLFHFYSHRGFQANSKVLNHGTFFWNSFQVKFYQYIL